MSAHRFHFRTRWLGYDRVEVDRLLDQVAKDRQILKDKLNYLEAVVARQGGLEERESFQRETEAVRAALSIQRLQLDRLKALTREMTACVDGCGATLREADGLMTQDSAIVAPAPPAGLDQVAAAPENDTLPEDPPAGSGSRRLAYVGLALLAVGGGAAMAMTHATAAATPPARVAASQPDVSRLEPAAHAVRIADAIEVPPFLEAPSKDDSELSLLLKASGTCWIRSVVDGTHVIERLMQAGDTLLVSAHDEILLRAGDGGALIVTLDGEAIPFGRAGRVVERRITRQNAKLLLQEQA
jgi:DivIVA domain-containing protein